MPGLHQEKRLKEGDQFVQMVRVMRSAQKSYSKERIASNLEKARRLEKRVDGWLNELGTK